MVTLVVVFLSTVVSMTLFRFGVFISFVVSMIIFSYEDISEASSACHRNGIVSVPDSQRVAITV